MYQQFRPGGFRILPPAVKNLMIINGLFYFATIALQGRFKVSLVEVLGMYWWGSAHFKPYQIITHVFMHGGFGHLFSNMFMLWMFGSVLENVWGAKRFLIYYFVTAMGAAFLHNIISTIEVRQLALNLSSDEIFYIKSLPKNFSHAFLSSLPQHVLDYYVALNIPTVGASGAVFGVLLAFGMMFPNTEIYIYFLFPIKAKYFVMFYGALELWLGIQEVPGDNVAHFAHLGGMLFGFILVKYWNKHNRKTFY